MATESKLSSSIAFNTMRTTVGSWETQVLPTSQRAPAMGAAAARLWKSNPANAMTLPTVVAAADADGDGTIDVAEFKVLLEQSGGKTASVEQLFSQIDKDGDGELTTEELSTLLDANRKFKARNT